MYAQTQSFHPTAAPDRTNEPTRQSRHLHAKPPKRRRDSFSHPTRIRLFTKSHRVQTRAQFRPLGTLAHKYTRPPDTHISRTRFAFSDIRAFSAALATEFPPYPYTHTLPPRPAMDTKPTTDAGMMEAKPPTHTRNRTTSDPVHLSTVSDAAAADTIADIAVTADAATIVDPSTASVLPTPDADAVVVSDAGAVGADAADTDDDDDSGDEDADGAAGGTVGARQSSAVLPPFTTAPPAAGATVAVIDDTMMIDPECYELELNHGRIGKIENLEPLVNIER